MSQFADVFNRQFADRVRAEAHEYEAARELPRALGQDLAEAGLMRLGVPEIYGGPAPHPWEMLDLLIEGARADGAVGWCLMIGNTTSLLSASLPDEWSQRLYGANPNVITVGVTAPMGRATLEGDDLRISGRWPFGSGASIADWICGGCFVMEDGEPRKNKHGAPETLLAFFEADQVERHDNWHVSGLRGTGSADMEVKDVLVPAGRWSVLGKRARVDAPLYQFPTLGLLALGVASVALGIAERAIETFTELADAKVPTGSTRQLAKRSSAQSDLAKSRADVTSSIAFIRTAIDAAWPQAEHGERLTTAHKATLRLAAANATWRSVEAVDRLYHAAGGSAIYHNSPLQRCFRDVHVATQHLMVAQPIYEVVGKTMLGIDPKTLL